ncbi:MAG: hypothetical protein ACLQNE_01530 [Thermoguttaceae bacterium]
MNLVSSGITKFVMRRQRIDRFEVHFLGSGMNLETGHQNRRTKAARISTVHLEAMPRIEVIEVHLLQAEA